MCLRHLCIKDGQWGIVLYIPRIFHVPHLPFHLLGDREAHIPSDPTLFLFAIHLPSCSCLLIGSPGCSLMVRWSSSRLFRRDGCCSCLLTIHSFPPTTCSLILWPFNGLGSTVWSGRTASSHLIGLPCPPDWLTRVLVSHGQSWNPSPLKAGWVPKIWSLSVSLLSVPIRIWHKGLYLVCCSTHRCPKLCQLTDCFQNEE